MISTIAKQLWPARDGTAQCEAQREGKYLNDIPETDKRCAHSAKSFIAGNNLCQHHAALAMHMHMLSNSACSPVASGVINAIKEAE